MKILIWTAWIDIYSKSSKTLTDKTTDCRYNVTLTIFYTSSTMTVRVLLRCMILKVSIKNSMIFLNVIWIGVAGKTKGAKAISELKDLFVFWSVFIKSINLSMLSLLSFELKTFSFRKTLLMSIMIITVL